MQAAKREPGAFLLAPREEPFNLVDQSLDVERLVYERVYAGVFGCQAVAWLRAPGCHQDRRRLESEPDSKLSNDIDTAAIGQAHVDYDEIGLDDSREQDRGLAVAGLDDAIAAGLDSKPEQQAKAWVVFADEDRYGSSGGHFGGSAKGDRVTPYLLAR